MIIILIVIVQYCNATEGLVLLKVPRLIILTVNNHDVNPKPKPQTLQ